MEPSELDATLVSNLSTKAQLDNTNATTDDDNKTKKHRIRKTRKVTKVENDIDCNSLQFEDSEMKDETYDPDKETLKRKKKINTLVQKKRPKLTGPSKHKAKTKGRDKKTSEESVENESKQCNSKESQEKPTMKRRCFLCKGLKFNGAKV